VAIIPEEKIAAVFKIALQKLVKAKKEFVYFLSKVNLCCLAFAQGVFYK
jgi:hypothetical protein